MKRYIAFLRGINVGGKNLIKMTELKTSFENIGYHHVITYIQSGNIVFTGKKTSKKNMETLIFQQIKKDFGIESPTIVRAPEILEKAIAKNPFVKDQRKDPLFFHITFLDKAPENPDLRELESKKQVGEEITLGDNVLYLYCPLGYGNTKLTNNYLEKNLMVQATTRNWKTINELLKIALRDVESM